MFRTFVKKASLLDTMINHKQCQKKRFAHFNPLNLKMLARAYGRCDIYLEKTATWLQLTNGENWLGEDTVAVQVCLSAVWHCVLF